MGTSLTRPGLMDQDSEAAMNTIPKSFVSAFIILMGVFLCPNLSPQSQETDESEPYWCPMRGTPCTLKNYQAAATCDDCEMELKPKSSFFLNFVPNAPEEPKSKKWVSYFIRVSM